MIIEIENLKKSFKTVRAVDDISFGVKEGELFSFLGVNGAGKSTTINIISGLLQKDDGRVIVCGHDLDSDLNEVKGKLGIVFQSSVLDRKLSVLENLRYRANLYGMFGGGLKSRIEEIVGLFELQDILKRPIEKLSGGQKRRIDIARALVHSPQILILDEPTTGLDPKTRINVWSILDKLRRESGLTVFLTTHYMEEAANADYVVIIDGGRIVQRGTPHELKNRFASDYIRFYDNLEEAERYFRSLGCEIKAGGGSMQVYIKNSAEIAAHMARQPQLFNDFEVLKGNMDDVFLNVTGKDLKEV